MIERIVVWFSAGVTSAIAAKIAVERYSEIIPIHLVNCDTGSEDEDNLRFMNDVSDWLNIPLEIIRNEKYKNTFDVYDQTGFFKNQHGAKCTVELKKKPRMKYQNLATDLQVFGFDAHEERRAQRFIDNNLEVRSWFPVLEAGYSKDNCREILFNAGIKEPRTYAEGFHNANCLAAGCVKGGIGYWNHIRKVRPVVFWNMATKEREIGFALLAKETTGEHGERIKIPVFLDELSPEDGNYKTDPSFQCSLFCGQF